MRLSTRVLQILVVLNWMLGAGILILLIALLAMPAMASAALGFDIAAGGRWMLPAIAAVMVIGLVARPVTHVILSGLLKIVDSVRLGDPFVVANAARLNTIAWCVLILQVLNVFVHVAVRVASTPAGPLMKVSFSLTGWLAVLLLFILARVFEHGAAMREDLEGTI